MISRDNNDWSSNQVLIPLKNYRGKDCIIYKKKNPKDITHLSRWFFFLSYIYDYFSGTTKGVTNPLQCSCLENPRDGGAWWATVYGVAQSWTRLKWLSSKGVTRGNYLFHCQFLASLIAFLSPRTRYNNTHTLTHTQTLCEQLKLIIVIKVWGI